MVWYRNVQNEPPIPPFYRLCVYLCKYACENVRWLKGLDLGSLVMMHFLTLFTLWDVTQLPSFVFVSGVAPDSVFMSIGISTEVVFAFLRVIALVRCVYRPHLTLLSRSRRCYFSLVIFTSCTILAETLTSW